jgi:hypothetical protein
MFMVVILLLVINAAIFAVLFSPVVRQGPRSIPICPWAGEADWTA